MAKAIWNGTIIAESDATVVVEGNHYFPQSSLSADHFSPSETRSVCPWKGEAKYYTIDVNGATNIDSAWTYPEPKSAAAKIKDHVAFWRGVEVVN